MDSSNLEVADVIRRHAAGFLARYGVSSAQRRVLRDLADCRTAALGGHVQQCDRCAYRQIAYNSCRNRHCPKCQASARAAWLEARRAELLPVEYHHVVFTLPAQLAPIALQNPRVLYAMLFRAAAETLQQIASDPKHLGAQIGFLAVLHTWGQNLLHHPHVHCVVPGGGLAADGTRWIASPKGFFLPVRVLSQVFRGKFLDLLKRNFGQGKLSFHGRLAHLANPQAFARLISDCYQIPWVVYSKAPFGGPEQVLKYLARYTHRVAISNRRLLAMCEGKVTFAYKDYARGHRRRSMTLDAQEFLRRLLLHVLPKGLVRIRHYGFLANRCRQQKLARLSELLQNHEDKTRGERPTSTVDETASNEGDRCPACHQGHLVRVEKLAPLQAATGNTTLEPWDTS